MATLSGNSTGTLEALLLLVADPNSFKARLAELKAAEEQSLKAALDIAVKQTAALATENAAQKAMAEASAAQDDIVSRMASFSAEVTTTRAKLEAQAQDLEAKLKAVEASKASALSAQAQSEAAVRSAATLGQDYQGKLGELEGLKAQLEEAIGKAQAREAQATAKLSAMAEVLNQ